MGHTHFEGSLERSQMRDQKFIDVSQAAVPLIPTHYMRRHGCPNFRPFKQCAAFAGMFDAAKAKACTPSKGVVKEPMGNEDEVGIPRLPGCNPLCECFQL